MDPVTNLEKLIDSMVTSANELLTVEDPEKFDQMFEEKLEPELLKMGPTLAEVAITDEAADRIEKAMSVFMPLVVTLSKHSEKIGATKGQTLRSAAAAGGRRRKMSRKYCKKTPCRKMGFTQKASCRPYKNCYRKVTRKVRRSGY